MTASRPTPPQSAARLFKKLALAAAAALPAAAVPAIADHHGDAAAWHALFDGESLEGWEIKSGFATYEIDGDAIVGTTADGSPNTFLCTTHEFGDFELEFEVKVDNRLNSGVQIRSKLKDVEKENSHGGRVYGPQVEIEASGQNGAESGYIYGEATGRGWLTPDDQRQPHQHFVDGEWNHYRILAEGPRIQTWINGHQVSDLSDTEIYETHPSGIIGLQVHGIGQGSGPMQVAWRNLKIREVGGKSGAAAKPVPGADGFAVLFDGSSLDGWVGNNRQPTGWKLEDGAIARVKDGGDVWTAHPYGDFVLELEYKVSEKCNSGLFFRADPKNPVQGGFEIQIFDSHGKKPNTHNTGALYDALAAASMPEKPAGEWNSLRLVASGPHVKLTINGTEVQNLSLDHWIEPNRNPDGSENKFGTALKDLPRSGHIGFQDHGHDVWYRNVRIMEL